MSKFYKAEDVEAVLADKHINRPLDSDRWVIGDIGKSIAALPTIEVSDDAISREYVVKKLKSSKEFYLSAWEGFSNMDDKDKARCDELDNCIATVINAPPVVPKPKEGEWIESPYEDADGMTMYKCSECGCLCEGGYNYCFKCGAKMRGDNVEDD